jgi:hypothetical protein
MAVTMRNAIFWYVTPCGSCKRRRFGGIASSIRMTRISELGTMLAVTSNQSTLLGNTKSEIACGLRF